MVVIDEDCGDDDRDPDSGQSGRRWTNNSE